LPVEFVDLASEGFNIHRAVHSESKKNSTEETIPQWLKPHRFEAVMAQLKLCPFKALEFFRERRRRVAKKLGSVQRGIIRLVRQLLRWRRASPG
jgi:hypothetical protein